MRGYMSKDPEIVPAAGFCPDCFEERVKQRFKKSDASWIERDEEVTDLKPNTHNLERKHIRERE
jgi:hypothetical protein